MKRTGQRIRLDDAVSLQQEVIIVFVPKELTPE
jgi:hypothetical protein